MRKSDREITDRSAIDEIIRRCRACRLGLSDEGQPYVVPLNFGYDGHALYFHGAMEGRKIDVIRKNSRVCFEFDIVIDMVEAEEWVYEKRFGYRKVGNLGAELAG